MVQGKVKLQHCFADGEKFADCDLVGIPVRLVISEKTGKDQIEWKDRSKKETKIVSVDQAIKSITK